MHIILCKYLDSFFFSLYTTCLLWSDMSIGRNLTYLFDHIIISSTYSIFVLVFLCVYWACQCWPLLIAFSPIWIITSYRMFKFPNLHALVQTKWQSFAAFVRSFISINTSITLVYSRVFPIHNLPYWADTRDLCANTRKFWQMRQKKKIEKKKKCK